MVGFLIQSPVEHFALSTPDHPALACAGEELSYRDLDRRSNQLAHALLSNGARPQDRVAIYMYKSLDLGVAIYGILKAGCLFVPIDPFMPVKRLSLIISDCAITHAVCSEPLLNNIRQASEQTILQIYGPEPNQDDANTAETSRSDRVRSSRQITEGIITPWSLIGALDTTRPDISTIDQDLGYIMYTSGSTGVPKGMTHSHHGSISYARWGADHVGLTAADRVASHAPLHFDLSIFDFFSTAQSGATVVLIPEAVTRFPASWTKTMETERISVVFTVPYTLISMLEQGAMDQRDLRSLRWILYGGEPFPPAKLRELMLRLTQVQFTNVYGPAEAPSCTCHRVNLPAEGDDTPIPIGHISRNSSGIIIDESGRVCEDARAGELCIRSSTLTKGYWNRPELNAAAYLMLAGAGYFPDVYFRTGDWVSRDTDGTLHFLGRADRMIKVRGQRVELDEVESVLASHPAVFEAAVFSIADQQGSQEIIAAVSTKNAQPTDDAAIARYARTRLPAYAIPAHIKLLDNLPHNSSGKIDRKRLATEWQH